MATLQNQKSHSSGSVAIQLGGKTIGIGNSARSTETWEIQTVQKGIGSIEPLEHVPTNWSCTIEIDKFYMRKKSLVDLNIVPEFTDILKFPLIDIVFLDVGDSDTGFLTYSGCTLQTRSLNISHNAIMGESATWLCLQCNTDTATAATQGYTNTGTTFFDQ
jgi:hypothetical protein